MATPGLWRTLRGWAVWLCGLLALGLVDRVLRLEGTGGLGEPATVLLSLGLAR